MQTVTGHFEAVDTEPVFGGGGGDKRNLLIRYLKLFTPCIQGLRDCYTINDSTEFSHEIH